MRSRVGRINSDQGIFAGVDTTLAGLVEGLPAQAAPAIGRSIASYRLAIQEASASLDAVQPSRAAGALGRAYLILEFTFDTTRAALSLVWNGTVERFPNIRFILSHAGGTVPFLAWRMSLLDRSPQMKEHAPLGARHYLRRFYYDTALSANPHGLRSVGELVPPSQVLFGSDYPFAPEPVTKISIVGIQKYDGFDESARSAIGRETALALFSHLEQRLGEDR